MQVNAVRELELAPGSVPLIAHMPFLAAIPALTPQCTVGTRDGRRDSRASRRLNLP